MKSAVSRLAVVSVLLLSSNAYAQGTCASGGGNHGDAGPITPYLGGGAGSAYPENYPNYPSVSSVFPTAGPQAQVLPVSQPAAPKARITVIDASSSAKPQSATLSAAPAARITVVSDIPVPAEQPKVVAVAEPPAATPAAPVETEEPISEALKGLVGTWKAVARRGDGELSTIELRLDDRGWAELTVPGADGKPSTIKRRAELESKELKLNGPDSDMLLGELIDVNSRQMVLARSGGQVTFVRL